MGLGSPPLGRTGRAVPAAPLAEIAGSYSGKDRSPMGRRAAGRAGLTAPGVDHDVNVYPSAGHGFISDPSRAGTASRSGRT